MKMTEMQKRAHDLQKQAVETDYAGLVKLANYTDRAGVVFTDKIFGNSFFEIDDLPYVADILSSNGPRCRNVQLGEALFGGSSGYKNDPEAVSPSRRSLATGSALVSDCSAWKVSAEEFEYWFEREEVGAVTSRCGNLEVILMLGSAPYDNRFSESLHQTGMDPAALETYRFASKLHNNDNLTSYHGVYIHAAHGYKAMGAEGIRKVAEEERDAAVHFAENLKIKYGIESKMVSIGSTPTCSFPPLNGLVGITEIHAGNYLVYDTMQACEIGSVTGSVGVSVFENHDEVGFVAPKLGKSFLKAVDSIAMRVKVQVIGICEQRNALLIDCGWTGLSVQGANRGFGEIISHPELKILNLKQETGEVGSVFSNKELDFGRYPIGTVLTLLPYHACAVGHQYGRIYAENEFGQITGCWKRCPIGR